MAFDSSKRMHRPGERVPTTGIYKVLHHQHREPHDVVLKVSDRFPSCQQCGAHVRFELTHPAAEMADEMKELQ
jgi:hypothetical protein